MLSTNPAATASAPIANTIGTFSVACMAALATVDVIATMMSTLSSRSRSRAAASATAASPPFCPNEEREMPALFKPGRPQPVAQRLDGRLEGAATVNDANASDASLSAGSERPRAGRKGEECDDLPPPHEHLPRERTCSGRE